MVRRLLLFYGLAAGRLIDSRMPTRFQMASRSPVLIVSRLVELAHTPAPNLRQ